MNRLLTISLLAAGLALSGAACTGPSDGGARSASSDAHAQGGRGPQSPARAIGRNHAEQRPYGLQGSDGIDENPPYTTKPEGGRRGPRNTQRGG